ncbi:MAG: transporter substrate-binding domain-containing protein [Oscillospiraceae bacterium]|jgi:ABC-type amino acid transport substrate-binding protein|nr:transporter substrate-binding domain-containing protein [Oscillospiraceae bacterium]
MRRVFSIPLAILLLLAPAACSGQGGKSVKSPGDFPGAKIAVQVETTADDSISEMAENSSIDIKRYPVVTQCFNDLKAGRVDAVYVDNVVATFYMKDSTGFERIWVSSEAEPLGICLRKDSGELAAAIEAAVDTLYYNGKMTEFAQKHFGEDLSANIRHVTEQPVIPSFDRDSLFAAGKLSIGCEVGYPPMEYTEEDGTTYVGFDIDVGAAVAELLGLDANVIHTAWEGIFAGLETGRYDCIISSVSITPERKQAYILTDPYVSNELCIVVKKK